MHRVGLETGLACRADTIATVLARSGRVVQIAANGFARQARLAFSCLVQPEPGDAVLIAEAGETTWVLAVLERHGTAPMLLLAEGDLTIAATGGALRLAARDDVAVDAGATARVAGHEVAVHASVLRSVVDEVVHVGRRITGHVGVLRVVAELVESFAEHTLLRARRSTRLVEQTDHVRAGEIDHAATGTVQIQAKQAFISADTVVRIDAAQIHMG
jgi:hypothetical protein